MVPPKSRWRRRASRLEITDEAVQMHGAMGVTQDVPLARMWTSLRTLRLADGPDAVHRRQVARAELKRSTNQKMVVLPVSRSQEKGWGEGRRHTSTLE